MEVGILTLFHNSFNWGGVLQGYALKTYIERNFPHIKADLLIYHSGHNVIYANALQQAVQYSPPEILEKLLEKFFPENNSVFQNQIKGRKMLFRAFIDEFTTNPQIYDDDTLIKAAEQYDCLICGSDQIWNPNVARAGFFLKTVDDQCKKVAYAASIARNDLSSRERSIMIPLIERFDCVSVREKTAKQILDRYITNGKAITEVLDPALMLSQEEWNAFAGESCQEEPYALAFFYGESLQYRKKIETYCQRNHLKLKFIPFAQMRYLASDEQGSCERLFDVGPREFVRLFQQAECVFTDSFHGSVFSLLFEKPFCVFERDKNTNTSKNSRLYDLLEKFELSTRLIADTKQLDNVIATPIDYDRIKLMLEHHRMASRAFLTDALNVPGEKTERIIERVDSMLPEECCGCGLCEAVCPRQCIKMEFDSEGFAYPVVDDTRCISCGLCLKQCQMKHKSSTEHCPAPEAFLGYHPNDKIRANSSSGGLFYPLAEAVIRKGGCVYGAAINGQHSVVHIRVATLDDLPMLMTSKYVQSVIDQRVYEQLEADLRENKTVLFSGTPCQIAAIREFARKAKLEENLFLVDFICHGVPSPGVWNSYIKVIQQKYKREPVRISFRDKINGWHDFHFSIDFGGKRLCESHETNAFMRSFLSDNNLRPSCYACKHKNNAYVSDISLADAWKIEKDFPEWADDKGTSLIICRTTKGHTMLREMDGTFLYRKTKYEQWKDLNPSLQRPTKRPGSRGVFFSDFQMMVPGEFWKKYSRIPVKRKLRYAIKQAVKMIGLEKTLRKRF